MDKARFRALKLTEAHRSISFRLVEMDKARLRALKLLQAVPPKTDVFLTIKISFLADMPSRKHHPFGIDTNCADNKKPPGNAQF